MALETQPSVHPLFHAGKWLLADLLSTLFFVGIYALTKNVFVATSLAIMAGLGQMVYLRVRRRPVDFMQWLSLALVLVFGAASFLTHDPRFIMAKPTLIYLVVAGAMLKKGWMARYMPTRYAALTTDVSVAFGYVWAALMALSGILNAVIAVNADTKTWAWFVAVFPMASKAILVFVQYLVTRTIVKGRLQAARLDASSMVNRCKP